MPRCHIALGGNLGPVAATFRSALRLLNEAGCDVASVSRFHLTAPVGGARSDFLNAAVAIETGLTPAVLLDRLQAIESELGRTRDAHWGPRTIDLDLIFYGDAVIETPRLTVPHPFCWFRRFVLDPLAEIAAEVVHPVKLAPVGRLRQRLLERPLPVACVPAGGVAGQELVASLVAEFPEARFTQWAPATNARNPSDEPKLLFWFESASRAQAGASETIEDFTDLPLLPRVAVCANENSPLDFVRSVLQSALQASRVTGESV